MTHAGYPSADHVRAALELLREADQLLYAAPRTEARDRLEGGRDVPLGAVLPVAGAVTVDVDFGSTNTGAEREYDAAIRCLRATASQISTHPAAGALAHTADVFASTPIAQGAPQLAREVRAHFDALRSEFSLESVPPLTLWGCLDDEDVAVLEASNVRASTRTWALTILALWTVIGLFVWAIYG